jgi:hypothetical protein
MSWTAHRRPILVLTIIHLHIIQPISHPVAAGIVNGLGPRTCKLYDLLCGWSGGGRHEQKT